MLKVETIVLAEVPSKSKTGGYKICLDQNNTVFCTCDGWRFNNHRCSHLDDFRATLRGHADRGGLAIGWPGEDK